MRNPRPTPVTVFGSLNLLFGGWGALTGAIQIYMMVGLSVGRPAPGASYAMRGLLFTLLPSLVSAGLFVAGLGLLQMKPWGRKLAIVLSLIKLVFAVLWMGVFVYGISAWGGAGVAPGSIAMFMFFSGAIVATGFLFPALQVYYMTRPFICAAFVPGVIPATVEEYRDIV